MYGRFIGDEVQTHHLDDTFELEYYIKPCLSVRHRPIYNGISRRVMPCA